jgi:hypothetical protein
MFEPYICTGIMYLQIRGKLADFLNFFTIWSLHSFITLVLYSVLLPIKL